VRLKIDSSQIGTPLHLIVGSDGSLEWTKEADTNISLSPLSNSDVSISDILRICGLKRELSLATQAHTRSFESLGVSPSNIPWLSVLGKESFRARVQEVIDALRELSKDQKLVEYTSVYAQCQKFLSDLERPRIDVDELRRHVSECESGLSVVKTLKSFSPCDDGLAPRIVYDHAGTATGRLTVKEGPSILTLPKSCRSVIRSPRGGSLWEVDFVSLEPRFVLHVMGKPAPRDIYEDIRQKVFRGDLDRKTVKTATISALYGSSAGLMSDLTGESTSSRRIIKQVKEYFSADDLGRTLSAESASGMIHSYYGRPLTDMVPGTKESKLISYYVQSSCVDTALLGFIKFCEKIRTLGARPIYVIHDALIIDVPLDAESDLAIACREGIDLGVGHFEVSSNRIS
jgi:hypothetical protein